MHQDLEPLPLPAGVRCRFVDNGNGLRMHCLEAGQPGHPLIVLLHGFPELAFSWRHQMLPLAAAGFHVIAPDQRGCGRTTGWDAAYDGDLDSFRMPNLVRDVLGLVFALGHRSVFAIVGHDFGSLAASWCALIRPDVFRSLILLASPFAGPPPLPFDTARSGAPAASAMPAVLADLATLPRPREHYQHYYSTRRANADMHGAAQGVHDFLRAYYHLKSADWPLNRPHRLPGLTADALALLPVYYVMDAGIGMAATVAPHMPSPQAIAACAWLPDDALRVYSSEFERTGFQGGLQWYRCNTTPRFATELQLFGGKTIDAPTRYLAGRQDWGVYMTPGAFEAMQTSACSDLREVRFIEGAGHWLQQEQPQVVNSLLIEWLGRPPG